LQSTNEELETTNEELETTNEELETTNEELQSTNEELETTVEELQATNAELATLNTELEHRTAELRRMDDSHQSFLNSLEQGIIVLDRAGTIETWNQAAERMWGLRHAQIVGRQLAHLPLGQLASATREAYERVLRTAQPEDVPNIPYILPGGESRHANMHLSPLKDGDGEVIGVLGVLAPTDAASPRS
jgi:two-component system, chemotaxis family, CheB/CheR fusion protein